MMNDRLYKNHKANNLDPKKTFIQIDSADFRKPISISLERIGNVLQLKVEDDLEIRNVSSVKCLNLENEPNLNPEKIEISPMTNIAVDENYLYIWVEKISKWKRILLSDWESDINPLTNL